MRAYECVYILIPTLEEHTAKEKVNRFSEIVTSRKGTVQGVNHWGKKKLAYPIRKFHEGIYTVVKFIGDSEILDELNRIFRFDDDVLRHLIVVDEDPVTAQATLKTNEAVKE